MLTALTLGVLAGLTTTVAGLGGGQILVLGLAISYGPLVALTVTGPALLVGNLHRLRLFQHELRWRYAGTYALGAFPGALVGGWWASSMPERWLLALMVGMTALAVAKHILGAEWSSPVALLVPGGALVGGIAATGGGGGVIAGPMLRGAGADDGTYMAAMACGAATIHVGRMVGYSAHGQMNLSVVAAGLALALCITAGNLLGMAVRRRVTATWRARAEVAALVFAAGLAVSAAA